MSASSFASKWLFSRRADDLTPNDYLSQTTLLRLLLLLALVVAPHLPHLPIWISAGVGVISIWRAWAARRHWRMAPSWLKTILAFSAFAGVFFSYGHISGQTAGVALLTAMGALKLTELRSRRDVMFMMFLLYFMLITHFLFSQALWTIGYLLLCVVLITALLVEVNHAGSALPPRVSVRVGGMLVVQALPLMVVLFLLFPRIPGPLWGIPADAGAAKSGLSDSMAPGDLSQLLESDALAFRVRFFGDPPAMRDRYWRGPVFDNFDGRRWTASFALESNPAPPINYTGGELSYEITLEPNNQPWLLALELPRALSLPDDAHLNAGAVVITKDPVRERRLYRMTSSIRHQLQQQLDPKQRDRALRLPLNSNPRTVALGRAWQSEGLGTDAIISRALHWFHDEQFVYTLQPPRLEQNPVDQFLFETRRGFCEHYASAFTVLMRAAGIPARIVTGYQGGDRNAVGDYFIVHQSDAHAWSEVWIENQGWVRIDPTAAVAPERIENGISQALRNTADLPSFLNPDRRFSMRYAIEARWDWVNAQWDRWVLGYGPELQHDLFSRFGLDGWRDLMLALTIVMSLLLGVIGVIALRSYRDPILPLDEASRLWNRLRKKMARAGFAQQPGEGATDYARRIAAQRPELATDLLDAARAYQAARYLPDAGADTARSLKNAIDRIRL